MSIGANSAITAVVVGINARSRQITSEMIIIISTGDSDEILPNSAPEISDSSPVPDTAVMRILTEPMARTRSQFTQLLNFFISSKSKHGKNITESPSSATTVGLITGRKLVRNQPTITAETITSVFISAGENFTSEYTTGFKSFSGLNTSITLSANSRAAGIPTGKPTAHHFRKVTSIPCCFSRSITRIFAGVPAGDIKPPIPAHAGTVSIRALPRFVCPALIPEDLSADTISAVNSAQVARLETNAENTVTSKAVPRIRSLGFPPNFFIIRFVRNFGIAPSDSAIVIPEDAMINSAVFTPKFESASLKLISPRNGSRQIIISDDREIGIASDIQRIRHAPKTPTARSCRLYSVMKNESITAPKSAAAAAGKAIAFLVMQNLRG